MCVLAKQYFKVKSSHQLDLDFKTINTILKSEKIWLKVTLWKRKGKKYVFQIIKNYGSLIFPQNMENPVCCL
jgi:hypothetical protein